MPNRNKIERSANYNYYADILWCCVPLMAMAWFFYGPRPILLMLVGLFTARWWWLLIAAAVGTTAFIARADPHTWLSFLTFPLPFLVLIAAVPGCSAALPQRRSDST